LKEIRNIIKFYENIVCSKEKLALASVVNVEESSYRRIGARMLISANGNWIGGISGGCLEGDALKRAQLAIFQNKPSRVTYDTMDDDSNQIGVGLGCNGRLDVLFVPIDRDKKDNPISLLKQIVKNKKPSVLLKIIESKDNETLLGATILVEENDSEIKFCALSSDQLQNAVQNTRIKRRPQVLELNNDRREPLKILIEYLRPETKLIIVGDNYDVIAMLGIAKELGWETYIVGRKKKMSKAVFHKTKAVFEYEEIDDVPTDEYTAFVLMSHDYEWDKKLLPKILKRKPEYLGVLGPRKRMIKMQEELGINIMDKYTFFHSPMGLDIGAESPEEIALSIAAEITAKFRQRDGQFLKLRTKPIHDRLL